MNMPNMEAKPVKLDAAGLTWFNHLKNEYLSLPPLPAAATDTQKQVGAAIADLLKKEDKDLAMQDNFNLEDWLVPVSSGPGLASRLKALRDDYQEVFGDDAWKKILPTLLPQIDPAKDEDNRAEAQRLLGELHWQASIRPWASKLRQWMMVFVLGLMGLAVFILWLNAGLRGTEISGSLLLVGVIGGAVSSIQRIQSANLATSEALLLARHSMLKLGVIISPLLGGIFALVLTLILLSKTVTPGLVIPDMTLSCSTNCPLVKVMPSESGTNNSALATDTNTPNTNANGVVSATDATTLSNGPNNRSNRAATTQPAKAVESGPCCYDFFTLPVYFAAGKDLALLFVLAFLAGFSERLVPDLLTKLADAKKP